MRVKYAKCLHTMTVVVWAMGFAGQRPVLGGAVAQETLRPVLVGGKVGYVSPRGKILLEPRYGAIDEVVSFEDRAFGMVCRLGYAPPWGRCFSEGRAAVKMGDGFAYVDAAGETICKPDFLEAMDFCGGVGLVKGANGWGAMTRDGRMIVDPTCTHINRIEPEALLCSSSGRTWVVDRSGRVLIAPGEYGRIVRLPTSSPVFACLRRGEWALVNLQGKEVANVPQPNCRALFLAAEGLVPVIVAGKWGYIDEEGVTVIEPFLEDAASFKAGLARAAWGGKYGYIDRAGSWVVAPRFEDAAFRFEAPLAAVQLGGRWGYVDRSDRIAIKPQYERAEAFQDGAAFVELGERWGLIDVDGRWLARPQFNAHDRFQSGLAAVQKDGKWGYLDARGRLAIPLMFDFAEGFEGRLAHVRVGASLRIIDSKGRFTNGYCLAEDVRMRLLHFSEGLAAVETSDGKCGYVDTQGAMAIRPEYERAGLFKDGIAVVAVMDSSDHQGRLSWGYIDRKGEWVWKPST
jgi:hypothetical protein